MRDFLFALLAPLADATYTGVTSFPTGTRGVAYVDTFDDVVWAGGRYTDGSSFTCSALNA